ncbi:MAG: Gfo/Idh/MocA family oxidoreductase [Clostridia bacterium]|nr:Gfo/Idh/MocA family oxidoreductase [Clostridia bacterium]
MIKVALIGIGGMGKVHFDEYMKNPETQIVAVADVRTDMAKEKVNDENIRIYADMDELLANEDVDLVDISTPSYMHAEQSIKALKKGKHVICEKPMSISSEDTSKMIEAARESGKLYMTAHVVRFMSPYVYLKSIIDSGELGKIVHIDMKRISAIPRWSWEDWMRDIKKSGGNPFDMSIHDIDFVQYAFGMPKSVSGVYNKMKNDNDYVISNLVYDDFTATITGGWFNCDIAFKAEYAAIFENGWVESKDGKVYKNGEEVEIGKGEVSADTGINLSGLDGYADEIAYFVSCIKNGTQPEMVTPESSEDSVKLVERILENSIII